MYSRKGEGLSPTSYLDRGMFLTAKLTLMANTGKCNAWVQWSPTSIIRDFTMDDATATTDEVKKDNIKKKVIALY